MRVLWRTSALKREKRREREQKKEGEREREKEKEGEGEGELSLFYSHFLLFRTRYASLHICFWTHSDDVAALFPSSSLSLSSLSPSLFMLSDILFQMVSTSFIEGLCVY